LKKINTLQRTDNGAVENSDADNLQKFAAKFPFPGR